MKEKETCEGCGEDKLINKNRLCRGCQVLSDSGAFEMKGPEDIKDESPQEIQALMFESTKVR